MIPSTPNAIPSVLCHVVVIWQKNFVRSLIKCFPKSQKLILGGHGGDGGGGRTKTTRTRLSFQDRRLGVVILAISSRVHPVHHHLSTLPRFGVVFVFLALPAEFTEVAVHPAVALHDGKAEDQTDRQ